MFYFTCNHGLICQQCYFRFRCLDGEEEFLFQRTVEPPGMPASDVSRQVVYSQIMHNVRLFHRLVPVFVSWSGKYCDDVCRMMTPGNTDVLRPMKLALLKASPFSPYEVSPLTASFFIS